MQQVEFILDHFVDKGFYFLLGKEMAGNVKHQPPPAKPGIIGDRDAGRRPGDVFDRPVAFDLFWQQLVEGLDAIEDTGGLVGVDGYGGGVDGQRIPFGAEGRIGGFVEDRAGWYAAGLVSWVIVTV